MTCLRLDINDQIKNHSLVWTCKLISIRKKYILLWQRQKKLEEEKKKPSPEDVADLQKFDKILNAHQIVYFRKLAISELELTKLEASVSSPAKSSGGWFSGWGGKPKSPDKESVREKSLEEKQKFYESVAIVQSKPSWEAAEERDVLISMKFVVKETEVVFVKQGERDVGSSGQELLGISIKDLKVDLDTYPKSTYVVLLLRDQ